MKKYKKSLALREKFNKYILKIAPFRKPVIKKGYGSIIEDVDGNKYIDLMSGQFCLGFGHSYKEFNEVVSKQLKKIIHTNTLTLTEEVLEASQELASITDGDLKKILLLSTGSEAVEAALRYAKCFTQKEGIVGIGAGYHGLTLASQSVSSNGLYAKPKVPLSFSIPTPDWLNRPRGKTIDVFINDCLIESEKILEPYKGKIAGFIAEPVISVGGMIFPPKSYYLGLSKIVQKHQALLIFDECQTGLGRTGKWFGYQHFDITPDMLIISKISGLGIPVSAVIVKNFIANLVEGKLIHFSSHQNDPLSGAVLKFVIQHIKHKKMLNKINEIGKYILKKLLELSKRYRLLENPRGLGLMIAFDLPSKMFNSSTNPGLELIDLLEEEGVIIQAIKRGKTFRILPNYLITKEEISLFINKLEICIKKLVKKHS